MAVKEAGSDRSGLLTWFRFTPLLLLCLSASVGALDVAHPLRSGVLKDPRFGTVGP